MYAANKGHAGVVEVLLDKRAEVDARDSVVRGPNSRDHRVGQGASEGPLAFSPWPLSSESP